ncbi:MAG: hypothetical protein R2771_06925 [Saprospiraceae bacterium]
MKKIIILSFIIILPLLINAQMIDGQTLKYGNEWINFNQEYFKIPVDQDGIYHITTDDLINVGIDVNNISANKFRLYKNGEEVPVFTSTEGNMGNNDFIEFIGRNNKGELDSFLFRNKSNQLNRNIVYLMTPRHIFSHGTMIYPTKDILK